jgi:hypothetical protein
MQNINLQCFIYSKINVTLYKKKQVLNLQNLNQ